MASGIRYFFGCTLQNPGFDAGNRHFPASRPRYIPDGSNGVYIIFLIIGIIGYFSVPTVAEWIIQSGGGASGAMGGINKAGAFGAGVVGGVAGNAIGKMFSRKGGGKNKNSGGGDNSGSGSPDGSNYATGGSSSNGYGSQ